MGTARTTFVIDENGRIEDIIEKVDTKNHAAQILKSDLPSAKIAVAEKAKKPVKKAVVKKVAAKKAVTKSAKKKSGKKS